MRRIALLSLAVVMILGCGGPSFKIPQNEYSQKVRTLGVLPLLVDGTSVIMHPEKGQLVSLIAENNEGKIAYLIDQLKKQKNYFDVRQVPGHPDALFNGLVQGSRLEKTAQGLVRHYDFNKAFLTALSEKNLVDGYLVVILHGMMLPQKRWDRTHLNYLESEYNVVIENAYVILPSGEVVWEHRGSGGDPFLSLQFPDFDEAHYNKTNKVKIKFVSIDGMAKILGEPAGLLEKDVKYSAPYRNLFGRITQNLRLSLFSGFKPWSQ
jgi:hypothetical protein